MENMNSGKNESGVAESAGDAVTPVAKTFTNDLDMTFVGINPGTFLMGSPEAEEGRSGFGREKQHEVTLTRGYYLQTTPVTHGQWQAVMNTRPWSGKQYVREGADYPAVCVSWQDAQTFIHQLSQRTGDSYALPTEAQWEYACRAGSTTRYCFGDNADYLALFAWYHENAGGVGEEYAQPVGQKAPNSWGLYDMHGNVYEWCQDRADEYPEGPVSDPTGAESGPSRVSRGGCFDHAAALCRSACRHAIYPESVGANLGFRLVCVPVQGPDGA